MNQFQKFIHEEWKKTRETPNRVETVNEDCKHKDCLYRCHSRTGADTCDYILYTGNPRGCGIRDCDKYVKETKKNKTRKRAV